MYKTKLHIWLADFHSLKKREKSAFTISLSWGFNSHTLLGYPTKWKYSIHLCSYVVNELSINSTKRVEDGDVGRKIVFWSVTQIREGGEAVICILRPWPADRLIPGETEGGGGRILGSDHLGHVSLLSRAGCRCTLALSNTWDESLNVLNAAVFVPIQKRCILVEAFNEQNVHPMSKEKCRLMAHMVNIWNK